MSQVQISQPAMVMIKSLSGYDANMIREVVQGVEELVNNRESAHKVKGYDDVFVTRDKHYRIIYRKEGNVVRVMSVQHESSGDPRRAS